MNVGRIPFELAIADDLLLGLRWKEFSQPQQVVLKAFYGLALTAAEQHIWSALQGNYTTDALGYLLDVTAEVPYVPREYQELWAQLGRRAGKTGELGSFIFAYECCLGGHTAYVRDGTPIVALLISQTKEISATNLLHVKTMITSSPLLKGELEAVVGDRLRLKNGITIMAGAPDIANQRGIAVPVLGLDEVAFWYSDADSANPDYEVVRALRPAQAQFPHRKRFALSTPWTREGIIYDATQAGTAGVRAKDEKTKRKYANALVVTATTAMMLNPRISRQVLEEEKANDPEAFDREFLVMVSDVAAGFLSGAVIEDCVRHGMAEQEPKPEATYIAVMDPAFRGDTFGAMVGHYEPGIGVVIDAIRRFVPGKGRRVDPGHVFQELLPLWANYSVETVYSDQGQFESLQLIANERGINLIGTDFTGSSKPKILGNLQQLINRRQVILPDPSMSHDAAVLIQELKQLQRKKLPSGYVQIAAPPGKHDDLAMSLALLTYHALLMGTAGWTEAVDPELPDEHKHKTPFEKVQKMLQARQRGEDNIWD